MRKRSSINSPGDAGKLAKSLARLVTGNPIAEDYSPIAKDNDLVKNPAAVRKAGKARPAKSKLPQEGARRQGR